MICFFCPGIRQFGFRITSGKSDPLEASIYKAMTCCIAFVGEYWIVQEMLDFHDSGSLFEGRAVRFLNT